MCLFEQDRLNGITSEQMRGDAVVMWTRAVLDAGKAEGSPRNSRGHTHDVLLPRRPEVSFGVGAASGSDSPSYGQ